MPELPEVETVKEKLKERLLKRTIMKASVLWDNIIAFPSKEEFVDRIQNQVIIDIGRRGKWLTVELTNYQLLIHLRMEGKFFFKDKKEDINKHEHILFDLDNDLQLRYHDTRKFGKMHLLDKDKINDIEPFNKLGLEPFDNNLTVKHLHNKLSNKKLPIKTVLLDQNIITGIGNIYADEILFLSGINPYKKANKLNKKELQLIINNTIKVLSEAIKLGGTTIRSYVSLDNKKGEFQNELYVHQRKDLPCRICGTIIKKDTINGRGTYYCSKCQK